MARTATTCRTPGIGGRPMRHDKLAKIFGKKSASMFDMKKHLSARLSAVKA